MTHHATIEWWQWTVGKWIDEKFSNDTLEHRGLALSEEVGEVNRAILKEAQQVRGTHEYWCAELEKECVDVLLCVLAVAYRAGFSLQEAMNREWPRIAEKYPEAGK